MTDEISLGELIANILKFVKKNFLYIIISAALGGSLGFGYYKFEKPTFESQMVVCTKIVESARLKDVLGKLEDQVKNRNISFVAEVLGVSEETANNIIALKVEVIPREIVSNPRNDPYFLIDNCVEITCTSRDPILFPEISKCIVQLINSNSLIHRFYLQRNKTLSETISYIRDDIEFIRIGREKLYEKAISTSAKNLIGSMDNETDLVNAYEKLAELKDKKELFDPVYVFKDFSDMSTPINSRNKRIFLGVFSLLFIYFGFVIFKEI